MEVFPAMFEWMFHPKMGDSLRRTLLFDHFFGCYSSGVHKHSSGFPSTSALLHVKHGSRKKDFVAKTTLPLKTA
jgi:hypothetical protein